MLVKAISKMPVTTIENKIIKPACLNKRVLIKKIAANTDENIIIWLYVLDKLAILIKGQGCFNPEQYERQARNNKADSDNWEKRFKYSVKLFRHLEFFHYTAKNNAALIPCGRRTRDKELYFSFANHQEA